MCDSEKPFACPTEGCNMSFVNEDHLTVHKKKHDMMLNLGTNNKNNFFIVDQTPTPTRFIRNCEEVGLFQDLQNDNPFEETFRRAVEDGKTGVLAVSQVNENDDTLHTPNIFPHMTEENAASVTPVCLKNQIVRTETKSLTESPTLIQSVSNKEIIIEKDACTVNIENSSEIHVNDREDPIVESVQVSSVPDKSISKSDTQLPIDTPEMQVVLKTQDGEVLRLIAGPIEESNKSYAGTQMEEQDTIITSISKSDLNEPVIIQDSAIVQEQKLSIAKMKLKQVLTKNGTVIEQKSIENQGNENKRTKSLSEKSRRIIDYSRKQAILERNRASSMRARAKRKVWIEQLQSSLRSANETNSNLQDQVKSLHAQVARLKTLLLAHKDCPVTQAMEKGNGIVVSSKVLTLKPNGTKQMPNTTATTNHLTKRGSSEKLIAPKKKPLILSTVRNPIILSKNESNMNNITFHGAERLKSIPTISFVTPIVSNLETSNGKTIFLRPDSGKVFLAQDILPVNENFNENAASKTTGT